MAGGEEARKRWSAVEREIMNDADTTSFNVSIPKSLKREITIEKARTGESFKTLMVRVWVEHLRRQYYGTKEGE